jgi:hypothetical protein
MQPVFRQQMSKHVLTPINTHATVEEPVSKQRIVEHTTIGVLLEVIISVWSMQSGYKEEFS